MILRLKNVAVTRFFMFQPNILLYLPLCKSELYFQYLINRQNFLQLITNLPFELNGIRCFTTFFLFLTTSLELNKGM